MTEKVPTISLIRAELKAPKSQYNAYGKFKYRNVEEIYEALKPLMVKYRAQYDIDEEIKEICGKTMTEVTVIYKDAEQTVKSHGYAEISMHKGMTPEQCIGTASSYATKYALNKLFQLDDSQDVDSMDNRQYRQTPQPKATAVMDEAANIKHKAETTFVDSSGTSLLDLCKQSKQEGGKGPAHQRIEAWIAENPELSTSKHNFIKRIGELNIV